MVYRLPTLRDGKQLRDYLRECRDNGDWGRSLLLLCSDGNEAIGILCIRFELAEELEAIYGNVSYVLVAENENYTEGRTSQYYDIRLT